MQRVKRYLVGLLAAGTLILAGLGAGRALAQPTEPPSDEQTQTNMGQSMREMADHCTAHMGQMQSMMGS